MKTKRVLRVHNRKVRPKDRIKIRILASAREQFLRYGFSSVTTDVIASSLGISKATLYRYFSSKEQLVREVIFGMLGEVVDGVDVIIKDRIKDFGEKLADLLSFIGMRLAGMSGLLTYDLQKNAPEVWMDIEEFRREKIMSKLGLILREGRENGALRQDAHQEFLLLMYITIIENMMNPVTLVPFSLSFAEAFRMIVTIILEGLLTQKGRESFVSKSRRLRPKLKEE
jgi:AcrR family transcriptional regulator